MSSKKNIAYIGRIDRGATITAKYLNQIGRAVNENTRFLSGPRQQQALEESENGGTNLNLDFSETARNETEVEVTDSNGDTHTITQIDYIELTNNAGQVMKLTFSNP